MTTTKLYVLFFGSFFAALFLVPLAIKLAHRFGVLDQPGHRKIHTEPMARLGGVAILAAALGGIGASYVFGPFEFERHDWIKLAFILGTTLLAAFLGLFDDLRDMKPRRKFLLQALVVGLFAVFGYRFDFLYIPGLKEVALGWLSVPITMFWIMAIWNGVNFMDGLDGLAGSVLASSLAVMGMVAILVADKPATLLFLPFLSAVLVFLVYNWRPARIYLGDAGTSALGVMVATTLVSLAQGPCVLCHMLTPGKVPDAEPFRYKFFIVTLLVAYPALEVTLSAARRGVKRVFFGRSMEWSEKEHIHHRLLKAGMKPSHICVTALVFNLALALAGFWVLNNQKALAVWVVMVAVALLTYVMPRLGFFDFLSPAQISRYQPHYRVAHSFITMQETKLGLVRTLDELMQLVIQTCMEFGVEKFRFIVLVRARNSSTPHSSFLTPDSPKGVSTPHSSLRTPHSMVGGVDYQWRRPEGAQINILDFMKPERGPYRAIKDKVVLPNHCGEAGWEMGPHHGQEALDVEYRVLLSGFMRMALERGIDLAPAAEGMLKHELVHDSAKIVRLHDLKKRG